MKGGSLLEVRVQVTPMATEAVAALMERVWQRAAVVQVDWDSGATTVSTYLDSTREWTGGGRKALGRGLEELTKLGLQTGRVKIRLKRIRRENWAESWKRHFQPFVIGKTLLIKPSWSKCRPQRGQQVVVLDPGLSFGTGHHPTTRYCLEQLVRFRPRQYAASLLDLGTGSGILAIAGAKLGYDPIRAIDADADAIRVARANARSNQEARTIRWECLDLGKLRAAPVAGWDVVCANLTSDLLISECPRILAHVRPERHLVVAGILDKQFGEVRRVYEQGGARLMHSRRKGEWTSATFQA